MTNSNLKSSIKEFHKKTSFVYAAIYMLFTFYITMEIIDISYKQKLRDSIYTLSSNEIKDYESFIPSQIEAGKHCSFAKKRNQHKVHFASLAIEVLNEKEFINNPNWKSEVKQLLSPYEVNDDVFSFTEKSYHENNKLLEKVSNSKILKKYYLYQLKNSLTSLIRKSCNTSCGLTMYKWIRPTFEKRGNNLLLFNSHPEESTTAHLYSINGSEYYKEHFFKPTQKGMHYLDIKEKFVFNLKIMEQEHCLELFVE